MLESPTIREELVRLRQADRLDEARKWQLAALAAGDGERSPRMERCRSVVRRLREQSGAMFARRRGRMFRWLARAASPW